MGNPKQKLVIGLAIALLFPSHGALLRAEETELTREQLNFFESKIRPVLVRECYGCHSKQSGDAKGGLQLDTQELMTVGGSSGPAIVPGDLEESLLFNAINHVDWNMPPRRKLPSSVIEDFREWIEMGAPDPRHSEYERQASKISQQDIEKAKENFWAYRSPIKPEAPSTENQSWAKSPIDRFILANLESRDLNPAHDAEPHEVLRRLCFDLVGLPPTPRQIKTFSEDWKSNPDLAIARASETMIDSTQYGERWGRHWLDVARYAESTGREVNMTYPHAWRYRDYVVDAFNADRPYNEFVVQQLAGDLMPAKTDEQWTENLIATTFLALGSKNVNDQNAAQFKADLIDEQIDTTTRVFLASSVACARCHDHKFDPIAQEDYYAMAGIFSSTKTYFGNPPSEFGNLTTIQARRTSSLLRLPVSDPNPFDKSYTSSELAALKEKMQDIQQQSQEARRGRDRSELSAQQVRQRIAMRNQAADLSRKLAVVDDQGRPLSYCMGVQDERVAMNARLLVQGEVDQPSDYIDRGIPRVMSDDPLSISRGESGRLQLARWIASADNPLTARVMVNRIWKHLMGEALVPSMENFGATGQMPTHPELLDYLAVRFVESGWSVKSLIKDIVRSRVYRISDKYDERSFNADPDNESLWRAHPRRLDAEAIRDAMLAASGELELSRPRASIVAEAGYVQVRDGFLGNPREQLESLRDKMMQEMRSQMAERRNSRASMFRRGRGQTAPRMSREEMAKQAGKYVENAQNKLNMVDANFRSIYLPVVRDAVPRSLDVFDFAESAFVVGKRETSSTPNQALYMLNNPFVQRQSKAFAERLLTGQNTLDERITDAFLLTMSRPPTSTELKQSKRFLAPYRNQQLDGMTAFCQSLFASASFRYVN